MSITPLSADLNIVQSLVIPELDDDLDIIQKLDDEPNDVGGLTAAQLKAKFDEGPNAIKRYINDELLPAISDTVAEADVRAEAEQGRVAAEAARVTAEQGRASAETGREQAEAARGTAEQARVAAEQGRATAEQGRATAEESRITQETARQDAEAERAAAEQERVNTDTGIVAHATQQATAAEQSATSAAGSAQTAAQQAALAQQAAGSAATAAASQLTGQMAGYVSDAQEAAQDAADAAAAISAYGTEVAVTLAAAGWTGSAAPYTQTVAVAGLLANSYGDIGPANSATAAQRAAYRAALIAVTAQADGSVTLVADGDKPAVDIPAVVRFGGVLDTGGGGGAYTLPAATADTLGGIKVGTGLSVEADGTLSAMGGGITVDAAFSATSENPVQNKVVKAALDGKSGTGHTHAYGEITGTPTIPTVPTALPNPHKLTFTGAVTGEYDGSAAKTINIPSGGGAEQLVVTFSESGSNWVSNRTFAEVRAAMDAGTPVIGYVASSHMYYALTAYNPNADYDYIEFALNYGHWVERFVLNETNEVSHEDVDLESDHLPYVTASDDGKLLQVVNGAWAAVTIENAAGGSY